MYREQHGDPRDFEIPEADLAAHAPEYYPGVPEGLQRQVGDEPELVRIKEPGIPINDEQSWPKVTDKQLNEKLPPRSNRSRLACLAIAFLIAVIAISLGIGLGVGLKKNQSANAGAGALNATSFPNPSTNFTRGVLNDTSLSTVTTSGGSRHVFFQDINGTLRRAVFSSSEKTWSSDADYLLPPSPVSPPRLGTPIATTYPSDVDSSIILVFYANVNNSLSAILYDANFPGVVGGDVFNGSIAIAPASRCLSAAAVRRSAADQLVSAILLLESTQGNITFLYGQHTPGSRWEWQNMNTLLDTAPWRKPGDDGASLACPCTINSVVEKNSTSPNAAQAAFFNPQFLSNTSASPVIGIYIENAAEPDNLNITRDDLILSGSGLDPDFLFQSSGFGQTLESGEIIAPFSYTGGNVSNEGLALVINETLRGVESTIPPTRVPFSRLAWFPFPGSSSTYIYHQINESALAEEGHIQGAGWNTTAIFVSTS